MSKLYGLWPRNEHNYYIDQIKDWQYCLMNIALSCKNWQVLRLALKENLETQGNSLEIILTTSSALDNENCVNCPPWILREERKENK